MSKSNNGFGLFDNNDSREAESSRAQEDVTEHTPLIPRDDREGNGDIEQPSRRQSDTAASESLLRTIQGRSQKKSRLKRWPSLIALVVLCVAIVIILVLAFVAPQVVSEYAKEAGVFEPTGLSISSFTATGVVARVQGSFRMDASRVKGKSTRDFGRFGTWIAREVETQSALLEVTLPEYGSPVIGTAALPPIKVNIRNGHENQIDFLTTLEPGSKDAIRRVADDWIRGRIDQLRVLGEADVSVKTGLITLPTQALSQSMVFDSADIPDMPDFDILQLKVHEQELPSEEEKSLLADVAIQVANKFPVDFRFPPLGFQLLVPGCLPEDYVLLANAATKSIHVQPKTDIIVNATGLIKQLPKEATKACPGTAKSPLDRFVGNYINGNDSVVYVRGSESPSSKTPQWISDLMTDIIVPVPFPGRSFGHLIKNFTMTNAHFDLPDPFADPDAPESNPMISAEIKALIGLPDEVNFDIGVNRVRASADVLYKKHKFGILDLHSWLHAESRPVNTSKDHSDLEMLAKVKKAPLIITDSDVFSDVVQEMLISRKGLNLTVKALVDVEMDMTLGKFIVRDIPAQGVVPVKPIGRHSFSGISPKVGNLNIADTSEQTLTLTNDVNFTNPTKYSAHVPYFDIKISVNDSFIGHATVENADVKEGENTSLHVTVYWQPLHEGGEEGQAKGAELLSQYISGYNTSLTFHIHPDSIPSAPAIGKALQNLSVTMPMPSLSTPEDPDDPSDPSDPDHPKEKPHFIRQTLFHLISSTAQFTLASPFKYTTMYITHMNATAKYKDHNAGVIVYDGSLEVPPGLSQTPRLPVDWSLDQAGFDIIKKALGGRLKLDARADVGVLIGEFATSLWYQGHDIGASVRL